MIRLLGLHVLPFAESAPLRMAHLASNMAAASAGGVAQDVVLMKGQSAGPLSAPSAQLSLRKDFVATAYFGVHRTEAGSGRVSINFRLPDTVSTFVLRAYVASAPAQGEGQVEGSTSRFGVGEASLVVARRLSLVPAVPRVVRLGDTFFAGVVVSILLPPTGVPNAGDGTASEGTATAGAVLVAVKAHGAVEAQTSPPQEVHVDASGMATVTFPMTAALLGPARLTFTATAPGFHASDGQGIWRPAPAASACQLCLLSNPRPACGSYRAWLLPALWAA